MVASHHLTLPTTIARTTAENATDLVRSVAAVRAAIDGLEKEFISKSKCKKKERDAYTANVQKVFSLVHGDRNEIGGVFREKARTSKGGRLQVERATLDNRFLILELEGRIRGKHKERNKENIQAGWYHRQGCIACRRRGRKPRNLCF